MKCQKSCRSIKLTQLLIETVHFCNKSERALESRFYCYYAQEFMVKAGQFKVEDLEDLPTRSLCSGW